MPTTSKSQQSPAAPTRPSRPTHCAACGAALPPPEGSGRPRRVCGDTCRQRYARKLVFEHVAERERLIKNLAQQMLDLVRVPITRPPAR